jgi:signal peptidase I
VSFETGSMFKRIGEFFLDILEVVVFAVAIFLFIYLLIMQPHKIKGASMEPNYPDGWFLLTDKFTYRFNDPQRGDVIVFEAPGQINDEYIKRIVALPGERVSINENKIFVNGELLNETYLPSDVTNSAGSFLSEGEEVLIPTDNYFVLGDNRPFSSDSRAWGTVTKEMITGRAWIIYWPINSLGLVEKVEY